MHRPLTSILALAASALAASVQVSFDPVYDNRNQSLSTVACSTGSNGLETKNFTTFGSLPQFPNIGGSFAVTGFNSAGCGTCWAVTFNNLTINILAIDVAKVGFNIAESTMNRFTNGQAVQVGVITADAVQVNASVCGLD